MILAGFARSNGTRRYAPRYRRRVPRVPHRCGLGRGFWHGSLAGSIGAIAIGAAVAIAVSVLGLGLGPLGPLLGAGVLFVAVFAVLLLGLESAIAGAIGAAVA